jgi:hypothetical protein
MAPSNACIIRTAIRSGGNPLAAASLIRVRASS